jgi:hypothetical protein
MVYAYHDEGEEKPSAPYVPVLIINPDPTLLRRVNARGLLDTGADFTHVPIKFLRTIHARPNGRSRVFLNVGKETCEQYPFTITLRIGDTYYPQVTVWTWENDFILIGRDILNQEIITFDGPSEEFEIIETTRLHGDANM